MKKSIRLFTTLMVCVAMALCVSCKKDEKVYVAKVQAETPDVTTTANAATISGTYSYVSTMKSVVIVYGKDASLSSPQKATAEHTRDSYSVTINNLDPSTKYYSYCIFDTGYGASESEHESFTTQSVSLTVTTSSVSNITRITATCGGNVTSDDGSAVTVRGVCWSTSPNPTVSDSHTTDGSGTGSFTSNITGLTASTTYYVRAYATNSKGTGYGEQKSFTTQSGGGRFSVSPTTTVEFAPGNLYWDGSAFRFEENQWSFADTWNASHVSHFFWSKTASVAYASSYSDSGASTGDVFFAEASGFQVSGETAGTWRTFSKAEWNYLLNSRTGASSLRAWVTLTDVSVSGLVILPDGSSATASGITTSSALAASGAVFLPAAGYRYGTDVYYVGSGGYYWSSTYYDSYLAYSVDFLSGSVRMGGDGRSYGRAVRLVR